MIQESPKKQIQVSKIILEPSNNSPYSNLLMDVSHSQPLIWESTRLLLPLVGLAKATAVGAKAVKAITPGGNAIVSETSVTKSCLKHVSHEKKPPTFHYIGLLIGILIIVYYNALYNWIV